MTHNFNKEESGYGTPFLDSAYNINHNPKPQNAVVYAHNSRWGDEIGFEGLNNYEDEAYYRDHPTVFYTRVEDGQIPVEYEIVAVIKERFTFDYRQPDFIDQVDFINYYQNVLSHKLYDTGKKIYQNDQLVTLSTCVFDVDSSRVAVIARRIK